MSRLSSPSLISMGRMFVSLRCRAIFARHRTISARFRAISPRIQTDFYGLHIDLFSMQNDFSLVQDDFAQVQGVSSGRRADLCERHIPFSPMQSHPSCVGAGDVSERRGQFFVNFSLFEVRLQKQQRRSSHVRVHTFGQRRNR